VVGDRVFTLADTGQMVCVDINTGKILWTKASNPWEIAGVEKEQAGKIMEMYQIYLDGEPAWWAMTSISTMSRVMSYEEFKPIVDIYRTKVQQRIVARLKELDPAGPWDAAAAETLVGLDFALAKLPEYKGGKFEPAPRETLGKRAALRNAIGKRISALSGNKPIPLGRPWHNIVGWCMASPVSDGKYVYAFFGQNYVVCYDLDGNVKWQHFIGQAKNDGVRVYQVASPVLRSGVLMVTESNTTIRALDAKTGTLLWRREGVVTGGHSIGTPKVVTLGPADKPLDALVTGSGAILRVKDGVIIGDLGYPQRKDGGPSIVGTDDFVVKGACGDNYTGLLRGYRLKYVSDDKIEVEMAWEGPKTGNLEPLATDGKTLLYKLDGAGYLPMDITTGKSVGTQSRIAGIGSDIHLWCGNYQIQCGGGSEGWGGRAADGSAQLTFTVLDVTNLANAKIVSTNVLTTKDKPRIPIMEKLAKELYDLPNYCSNSFGWPPQLFYTESGMTAMGNRLFLRATGQLYCIGDPAVPYNWNPASRPVGE